MRVEFAKSYLQSSLEQLKELEGPIPRLSHVTHNRQAKEITRENRFKAWPKKGSDLYGESFIYRSNMAQYERVSQCEHVLPGHYSWWGIHLQEDDIVEIKEAVQNLEANKVYVVNYLKYPRVSRYGNQEFYADLKDLLVCYGQSRKCNIDDIYLKVGGTLRYRNEICYVIIICTQNDDDLGIFPNIDPGDTQIFDLKGLVSQEGSVANRYVIPTFKPRYVLKSMYPGPTYFSWEGLAFAFYFPEDQNFEFPELSVAESPVACNEIIHPENICASKKSPHWKCPNHVD